MIKAEERRGVDAILLDEEHDPFVRLELRHFGNIQRHPAGAAAEELQRHRGPGLAFVNGAHAEGDERDDAFLTAVVPPLGVLREDLSGEDQVSSLHELVKRRRDDTRGGGADKSEREHNREAETTSQGSRDGLTNDGRRLAVESGRATANGE